MCFGMKKGCLVLGPDGSIADLLADIGNLQVVASKVVPEQEARLTKQQGGALCTQEEDLS